MAVPLIILGIIVTYCIIVMKVPNEKHPARCESCMRIKGDGKGVLYKGWVEVTCSREYNERLMNVTMSCEYKKESV